MTSLKEERPHSIKFCINLWRRQRHGTRNGKLVFNGRRNNKTSLSYDVLYDLYVCVRVYVCKCEYDFVSHEDGLDKYNYVDGRKN